LKEAHFTQGLSPHFLDGVGLQIIPSWGSIPTCTNIFPYIGHKNKVAKVYLLVAEVNCEKEDKYNLHYNIYESQDFFIK
jgi:hypothetical protein